MFGFTNIAMVAPKEDLMYTSFIGSGNFYFSIPSTNITTPYAMIDWGDSGVFFASSGAQINGLTQWIHPYATGTGVYTARVLFSQSNNSLSATSIRDTNIATGLFYFPESCTGMLSFTTQNHKLTGIHFPSGATRVGQIIYNNNLLKEVDLSHIVDAGSAVYFSTNELTGISFGAGYIGTTQLLLSNNKLKYFHLPSGFRNLSLFYINDNLLENSNFVIDPNVTGITVFLASTNKFTGFNLNPNWTGLTNLTIGTNNFSTGIIIPETYTSLETLSITQSQLSGLNLPSFSSYRYIYLNNNNFTGLTIPGSATGINSLQLSYTTPSSGFFTLNLEEGCNVTNNFSPYSSKITGMNEFPTSFTGSPAYAYDYCYLTGFRIPSGSQTISAQNNVIKFATGVEQNIFFTTLNLFNNFLPQSEVDTILAQSKTSYTARNRIATLNLSGATNSTPSAAGLADRSYLQSVGWTVHIS